MRRPWVTVAVATVLTLATLGSAGCTSHPFAHRTSAVVMASATAGVPGTPQSRPADPAATRGSCLVAAIVLSEGTKLFNEQLVALEKAAAEDDQTGMVAAATVINAKLVDMATTLGTLAKGPVSPRVRGVLAESAIALTEMVSQSYQGSSTDIRTTLVRLRTRVGGVCGWTGPAARTSS
jgi:hypothetical protein